MASQHIIRFYKVINVLVKKLSVTQRLFLFVFGFLLLCFSFCLPKQLFQEPYATIMFDAKGELLGARIANDEQWRFPASDSLPTKLKKSIVYFEDQYFYHHPGVNPVSVVKALIQNIRARRIVRGGSTITQQVIRISEDGARRSVFQKIKESVQAVRLEVRYTKDEILLLWANHAPFGGNVVGVQAAAWRYFGRGIGELSWAESATLAVLPNAPALIHPGRNRGALKSKRDGLLQKLFESGVIDSLTFELAILEPLPDEPYPLPRMAPHLLELMVTRGYEQQTIYSNIDAGLQERILIVMRNHIHWLSGNEIHNMSVMVSDVATGKVIAYHGNVATTDEHQAWVDIIQAERSSGSTLKPFLFGLMLDDGLLLPQMLLDDIPTYYRGFTPMNFDRGFDGAVPAAEALARSLNVPAVRLLHQYGIERFYHQLQQLGISTLHYAPDHYGLALILGGAEVKQWELHQAYALLAYQLSTYLARHSNEAESKAFRLILTNRINNRDNPTKEPVISDGAIWQTFQALSVMDRPIEGVYWDRYASSKRIAWKTGTSFGHRDAWAVGVNGNYVVTVWVGNADGEGRPGLTGASSAAPVLFDVFKLLPGNSWFDKPYDEFYPLSVCHESGYSAGPDCPHIDTVDVVHGGQRSPLCPFHQVVHLDEKRQYRVLGNCYPVAQMYTEPWFVLPPLQEWYFKKKHPMYRSLPPYKHGCMPTAKDIEILYPAPGARVFIPRNIDGEKEKVVCEAVSRTVTKLFWHLDEVYLGATEDIHQMQIDVPAGTYSLVVISENGQEVRREFEVVER